MKKLHRAATAATAVLMTVGLAVTTGATVAPALAQESGGRVTLQRIPDKTAPYRGKAVVKPVYSKSSQVEVDRAVLTVRSGGKVVARNKPSVSLGPGKYTVAQTVKYRPFTMTTESAVRYGQGSTFSVDDSDYYRGISCSIPPGEILTQTVATCTVSEEDLDSGGYWEWEGLTTTGRLSGPYWMFDDGTAVTITPYGTTFELESIVLSRDLVAQQSVKVHGARRSATKTQTLTVRPGAKPRTCATYADFQKVTAHWDEPETYGDHMSTVAEYLHNRGWRTSFTDHGDYVIEFRHYKTCDSGADISVGFFDGYAYSKTYYS